MDTVDLKRLYVGFVNSYNSLLLPSGEAGEANYAQDTHAIIDWFRRAGVTYGYYPYCEYKQRDLEWYTEDDKVLLHFESENFFARVSHTNNKIIESNAHYGVGLVWSNEHPTYMEQHLKRLAEKSAKTDWEALLIVRFANECTEDKEGCWHYLVKAWWIYGGTTSELEPFYIKWPIPWGLQTATWHSCASFKK